MPLPGPRSAGLRIAASPPPHAGAADPVRYLTNHSTGKMGYALARAAAMRGADVKFLSTARLPRQPVKFTTDACTTAQQM